MDLQGAALEIVAEFLPSQAAQFGLKVRCAPDGSEQTLIAYDPGSGWLSIDREHSSLDTAVHREPHGTHVELADGEHLTLQIFVDHSVVEVYANSQGLPDKPHLSVAQQLTAVGVELFARRRPRPLRIWSAGRWLDRADADRRGGAQHGYDAASKASPALADTCEVRVL